MRLIVLLILLALTGCTQLAGAIPSLQHCERVHYQREGSRITLYAECNAPIGSVTL